jgi:hypothetical protein
LQNYETPNNKLNVTTKATLYVDNPLSLSKQIKSHSDAPHAKAMQLWHYPSKWWIISD